MALRKLMGFSVVCEGSGGMTDITSLGILS